VLQKGVGGQDVIVWLDHSGGDLWGWSDGESQLRLFTVVNRQALEEKSSETRSGTAAGSVVHEETLEASAVVSELANSVQNKVDNFLANGVMTTGVVIGSVFLSGDQLLWVVKLAVGASADFVNDSWLEVNVDGAGDVLASTSLREKGVEGIVTATDGLVRGHLSVWLDTVLEAEKLPRGITNLATGLAEVDVDYFAHIVLVGED
jgi:hypothetical protein